MIEYYRQRPDGRYYWLYEDLYGQTRELNSWDVEELDKKVKAKRKELMMEVDIPNMLFQDYLEQWLANTHLNGKKPKTKNKYWSTFRNHIKDNALGLIPMKNLNVRAVQGFYNAYMQRVESSSIIKGIHKLLSPCLRYAYANGDLLRDFTSLLSVPADSDEVIQSRIAKSAAKPLTVDQHLEFIEGIQGHEYEALFRTSLDGGYRSGELLALTWDDVDFTRQRIIINKSFSYTKNEESGHYEGHTVATKNFQIRHNKMPKSLQQVLLLHKSKQRMIISHYGCEQRGDTLVFSTSLATHLDANNVNKAVKKVYETMGINWEGNPNNKCFHDLRHTYATRQFEQGVDVLTVSKLLGHRNVNTTIETYIHILEHLKDAVADATDEFYQSQSVKCVDIVGKNLAGLRLIK